MYNNQGVEMQNMYTVMERDKHYRQELTARLHHEEHVNHLKSETIGEQKLEMVRLNDLVFSHKESSNQVHDKLNLLQIELQDTREEMTNQQSNYRHMVTDLRAELEVSLGYAQQQEVSHVASKFQAGILASTASKLRTFVDEDEEEIARLNEVNQKLERLLEVTTNKLVSETRAHTALQKDFKVQSKDNEIFRTKIRVLNEVVDNLESEKARLEEALAQVTKKWEEKTASFNALASEIEMNNFVIKEMHSELDKEGQKRLSQINEKELELTRIRKESMDMETELMATENELRTAKSDLKKFERKATRAEAELKEVSACESLLKCQGYL